jgi:NADPH:quinone reductase-like Zn-dependent oxidoreductase
VAVARPASVERADAAGADHVVPLGDDVDALTAALREHGPFDVVLDPVWGVPATAASRVLAEGGRLVNLGGASGDRAVLESSVLRSRSASVLGYTNNALTREQRRSAVTAVLDHARAGRVTLNDSYRVHSLSGVEEAWRAAVRGDATRCVLVPD